MCLQTWSSSSVELFIESSGEVFSLSLPQLIHSKGDTDFYLKCNCINNSLSPETHHFYPRYHRSPRGPIAEPSRFHRPVGDMAIVWNLKITFWTYGLQKDQSVWVVHTMFLTLLSSFIPHVVTAQSWWIWPNFFFVESLSYSCFHGLRKMI